MQRRFILCLLLFCVPFIGDAQFDLNTLGAGGGSEPTITLSPAFPSPGETFTATIENINRTTNGSQITWSYAGTPLLDTNNQRSVDVIAGAAGSDQSLVATLALPQGGTQTVQTTVTPVYLDIIVEPQTRVPDWYLGRALPSLASQINVTALLNDGSFVNPNNIVYTWRINQTTLEGGPIRAGNQVSFAMPRGGNHTLSVTASDLRGNVLASRLVGLESVLTDLQFYEKHPLYGMQQTPINNNLALIGSAITVQAEPFYLDTRVYNQPDIAEWEINRQATSNGSNNPYEISLTRSGISGQTLVNFHVRSLREVLQGAEEQITVNF